MEANNQIYLTSDELVCLDPTYRYKASLPELQIMTQKGREITLFLNISKVARQLEIEPELLCNFIAIKLSCQYGIDKATGNYYFGGKYTSETVANSICLLVKDYILCDNCDKPETMCKTTSTSIKFKCKACGEKYKKPLEGKIGKLFAKFYAAV
jgi:translation initiation factor 2 beta subunit (eIF-2beta)/eIF-5